MEFTATLLSVSDMERSKQFYHEVLGLRVTADYGANISLEGGLSLQTQDSWQEFLHTDDVRLPNNACEIYFQEDRIEEFAARLKAFPIRYVHPLFEHGWGQRVVRFYDPDGHIIEVGESLNAVARRFSAAGLSAKEIAARMDISLDEAVAFLA